jgi:hypothetical protein
MEEILVEHAEVWVAELRDRPGALANKLAALAEVGADLEFIIARRAPEKPGTGVVFVTPLRGDAEIEAASEIGFTLSASLNSMRIEGANKPGVAAELTRKLAEADINLRGLSAAVIGTRYVMYLALDTREDAEDVMRILQG